MAVNSDLKNVNNIERALDYAIKIIENYQYDIRNSEWLGIDLVALGFCQGEIYQNAIPNIRSILSQ